MIIRKAKADDIEQIVNVFKGIYREESGENKEDNIEYFRQRITDSINEAEESLKRDFTSIVAEEDCAVKGILCYRTPHSKLLPFAKTEKPVELWGLFVSEQKKGFGSALIEKMTEEVKSKGYTEILVFSADRWKESWPFYDKYGFERVGTLPESGDRFSQVWSMILKSPNSA